MKCQAHPETDATRSCHACLQALCDDCTQEVLGAGKDLHWVQTYFAGVENCVNQPALKSGKLVLTNGQRLSGPTIAEHAIAMMRINIHVCYALQTVL